MKLITSHDTTDFDGLAACVAAQKLQQDAVIGFPGGVATSVHRYLAIHRDRFQTERCAALDLASVDTLIMVDVRRRGRLAHVEPILQRADDGEEVSLIVWDHHPNAPDDVRGDEEHVQPVGAVTSLLVAALRERQIEIDPEEATLFALGIHEDTGSLKYARTRSADADALSWLLGRGARASVIKRFLQPPLSDEERAVLVQILEHVGVGLSGGTSVEIVSVELHEAPAGLARVTTEAFRSVPHNALFCLFRLHSGKIHVIGRSQSDIVPVGAVLAELGGGGQPGAGSAVVHSATTDEVAERLRAALDSVCKQPEVVREVMSSPVHTVAPTMNLARLADSLEEWRHTGVPIVDGGKLVGVISHRDIEKARGAGRVDLPAASYMSHHARTIGPEAPLSKALEEMVTHDVGRLPVVEDDRVVGIISRTDILRSLYDDN